jgi:hypothetical protein
MAGVMVSAREDSKIHPGPASILEDVPGGIRETTIVRDPEDL